MGVPPGRPGRTPGRPAEHTLACLPGRARRRRRDRGHVRHPLGDRSRLGPARVAPGSGIRPARPGRRERRPPLRHHPRHGRLRDRAGARSERNAPRRALSDHGVPASGGAQLRLGRAGSRAGGLRPLQTGPPEGAGLVTSKRQRRARRRTGRPDEASPEPTGVPEKTAARPQTGVRDQAVSATTVPPFGTSLVRGAWSVTSVPGTLGWTFLSLLATWAVFVALGRAPTPPFVPSRSES